MLFSVVIPVYNVEKYIDQCLQSIIPQVINDKDIEIILVDDGSTDNSGIICDNYSNMYPDSIKVYHNENRGLLFSRRYGFLQATGEYIINCDSDDTLETNTILELRHAIQTYNPDVLLYNMNIWNGNDKKPYFKDIFTNNKSCLVNKVDVFKRYYISNEVISMCSKCFKRNCLDFSLSYEMFENKSFGEDSLQSAEIYTNAKSFAYINLQLYNYRTSSGMTASYNKNYYNDFKEISHYIRSNFDTSFIPNYEQLYSLKLFTILARSITQFRYQKKLDYIDLKDYLLNIQKDPDVQYYSKYYNGIKDQLSFSHRLFIKLFFSKYYLIIYVLLLIKNTIN